MTPERKAELDAAVEEILGPPPKRLKPKPKVVISDGVPVRDADVVVSRADPNARHGAVETVKVRRADRVTIDQAQAEAQWQDRQRSQAADRQRRRDADPFNLGHWGPSYD